MAYHSTDDEPPSQSLTPEIIDEEFNELLRGLYEEMAARLMLDPDVEGKLRGFLSAWDAQGVGYNSCHEQKGPTADPSPHSPDRG